MLGILRDEGWHLSIRQRAPVDADGRPLPWYCYSAFEWLSSRLKSSDRVFEFGSGFSTLWYAERVQEVIAVENGPDVE